MREEPHFKGITFIHNTVSNNGLHIIFSKLPFCPYFEYLHLTCETLNDVALEDFCQYLPSSHLRKVGFCEISCTYPSLQRLLSILPVACSLRSLHLEKLNLNAQTLQVLSTILNATNITELYFPGNPFGDEGIEVLTNCLSNSRKIQVLDFSNCAITRRGAVGLSHIVSNLETLKRLELYGNSLGCEGLRFLSQALQHSKLKHLDISECDIGDAGVRSLSQNLPGSKLQYLGIDSNFITDEGMKELIVMYILLLRPKPNQSVVLHLTRLISSFQSYDFISFSSKFFISSLKSKNFISFIQRRHHCYYLDGSTQLRNSRTLTSNASTP